MRQKPLAAVIGVASAALLLAGCGASTSTGSAPPPSSAPKTTSSSPTPGGVLKIGTQAAPVGIDPATTSAFSSSLIDEEIYEGLTKITPKLAVAPDLATSWDITNGGKTYTFHLRQGVTFSNGDPFTSQDVKWTFERIMNPKTASPRAYEFNQVTSIKTPDKYTVVIQLKQALAPFLTYLAAQYIEDPSFVKSHGGSLKTVAMGTGPYVLASYNPAQDVVLKRNPHYWKKGLPYINALHFLPEPDGNTRTTALLSGSTNFIQLVPAAKIDSLKKNSKVTMVGGTGDWWDYLGFNCAKPPFNKVKVRQAIAWALNKQAIVKTALFGNAAVIHGGPIPPSSWAYTKFRIYHPNLKKARELLKEAGYPHGFTATIKVGAQYKTQVADAQVIQAELKPLGINIKVDPIDWGTFLSQIDSGDFQMQVDGWLGFTDPDQFLYPEFHSGQKWNFGHFSNPQVDKLLDEGRLATSQSKRKQIYAKAEKLIVKLAPNVFLDFHYQYEAMAKNVHGYTNRSTGSLLAIRHTWIAGQK